MIKKTLKKSDITDAANSIIRLLDEYKTRDSKKREMAIDCVIFSFFEGKFGLMSRQKPIYIGSSSRPKRIDFRRGGMNPVVIELAVRVKKKEGTLYSSQNKRELMKLARIRKTKAKMRVLLLLDFTKYPISRERLESNYRKAHAGKGRFDRSSVRIIYVSRSDKYDFKWTPFKESGA